MIERVTHDALVLVSAGIIATLGIILPGIRLPKGEQWKSSRATRGYLALSCLVLAAINVFVYMMKGYPVGNQEEFFMIRNIVVLIFASTQAVLFTMTSITFIQPLYLFEKRVVSHIAIILFSGGLLLLSFFFFKPLFLVLFYIAMTAYLFQLVYYTVLFRNKYKQNLKQLEAFYDEDESYRIKWVRVIFYSALAIGVLVLSSLFLKGWGDNSLVITCTIFYVYVVIRFLNYTNRGLKQVLPAMMSSEGSIKTDDADDKHERVNHGMTEKELEFKTALDGWMEEKKYSEKDTGVEEIALSLGADISFLRYYFRTYVKEDFRTWRSRLRVDEACRMLEENPRRPLSEVCKAVGFNDKGNFHRQFEKITGVTPTNYKQDCRENGGTGCVDFFYPASIGSPTKEQSVKDTLPDKGTV